MRAISKGDPLLLEEERTIEKTGQILHLHLFRAAQLRSLNFNHDQLIQPKLPVLQGLYRTHDDGERWEGLCSDGLEGELCPRGSADRGSTAVEWGEHHLGQERGKDRKVLDW